MKTISRFNQPGLTAATIGIIVLMATMLTGCKDDDENYLEGSITSAYNMKFDSVRIRLYPDSALSIEYVKKTNSGEQIPLRLTIDQTELQLAAGRNYNIINVGSIGRGVGFESMPFPSLTSGTIRLDGFSATDGSGVNGDFEALFTGTDGKTLNLNGGFSGNLDRVD